MAVEAFIRLDSVSPRGDRLTTVEGEFWRPMLSDLLASDDPLIRRFAGRITITDDGCWQWSSVREDGYGTFTTDDGCFVPHRWAYETFVGPLPHGWTMDHVCRNRGCVKWWDIKHLEPVPHSVNIARAVGHMSQRRKAQTHCKRGHEFTEQNTRVMKNRDGSIKGRACRACQREYAR